MEQTEIVILISFLSYITFKNFHPENRVCYLESPCCNVAPNPTVPVFLGMSGGSHTYLLVAPSALTIDLEPLPEKSPRDWVACLQTL